MTEEKLNAFFTRNGIKAVISYYTAMKRRFYYAAVGEDHLPALLFIHGAPASMTIYRDFFTDEQLLGRFAIYAVDRPGYGLTGGPAEPSISRQSESIFTLAQRIHRVHQPLLVVAGSYGASIACRLVMDHPGTVQGLILIAPSLGPGLEKMFWITPLLAGSVGGKISKAYQSASIEKLAHEKELKKMLPLWDALRIPVCYLQSEKDPIVYPANAAFARQHMVNVPHFDIQFFKGRKHDIDAKYAAEIRNHILEMAEWIQHA